MFSGEYIIHYFWFSHLSLVQFLHRRFPLMIISCEHNFVFFLHNLDSGLWLKWCLWLFNSLWSLTHDVFSLFSKSSGLSTKSLITLFAASITIIFSFRWEVIMFQLIINNLLFHLIHIQFIHSKLMRSDTRCLFVLCNNIGSLWWYHLLNPIVFHLRGMFFILISMRF